MGTVFDATVWSADSALARDALRAAWAEVALVDSLMSVYRTESEISVVNRRAGTDSFTMISSATVEVLGAALRYARMTDGALDITVGPLVDVWGFYRAEGRVPPPAVLDSAGALVDYRLVELDTASRRVRLPRSGMRLDLGAIAKGYAVDRAASAMRSAGVERARADLGGNLRVFGDAPSEGGWRIGIRDPRDAAALLTATAINSGAVATSGDYEQFFEHAGVRYSHVIDPRTNMPARGIASATVLAPTGLASDALSTALFVMGPVEGCGLARGEGVEALWVLDPGTDTVAGRHVVATPGLFERLQLRAFRGSPRECG